MAVAAVEIESQPVVLVSEQEMGAAMGAGGCVLNSASVFPHEANAKLVTQAIAGGHEGFARSAVAGSDKVVVGLFEPIFYLLHSVATVELFGVPVDDVGTEVEGCLVVGESVGQAFIERGAVAAVLQVLCNAYVFKLLDSIASQLVKHRCGQEPWL